MQGLRLLTNPPFFGGFYFLWVELRRDTKKQAVGREMRRARGNGALRHMCGRNRDLKKLKAAPAAARSSSYSGKRPPTGTARRACAFDQVRQALIGLPTAKNAFEISFLAWRMAMAKDLLRRKEGGVAEMAERVGYGSASAFSVAFTRHVGLAPARYAREVNDPHL